MVKLFSYRFVLLCTCFAFCAHARLFAQFEKNYSPVNYSAGVKSSAKDQFFKNNSFTYGEMNQEEKNKFEKYLYSLHLAFCEVSNKGYFIQEKFFVDYFQNILDRILTANNISQKIEVVVTRSSLPNAYNIGDNKLYINIGLISQIQNESQIAFLLGHELSHQLLFHVQNSFIAAEKRKSDQALQKEIKDIEAAKFNKLDRAFALAKNMQYEIARYSRENERSADSLAVILLSKTNYDLSGAEGMLKVLEHCEEDTTSINYKNYFQSPELKWNDNWMKPNPKRIDFGGKEIVEINRDSLSTHPDIPNRIIAVNNQIKSGAFEQSNRKSVIQSVALLDSVRTASKFEMIAFFIMAERYAAVVFHSLSLMNSYPENKYLRESAANAMDEILTSLTSHKIQEHMPIISDELPASYNQLLNIIEALPIKDLRTLQANFKNNLMAKKEDNATNTD